MASHILVVEDEKKISDLVCRFLVSEGYTCDQAFTGKEALSAFDSSVPNLVLLDIMLPDMHGIAVCEKIRTFSQVPIVMLTARVDDVDRILGFDKGADDYVCKPFNPEELMARVRAILRRTVNPLGKKVLSQGEVTVFVDEHRVMVAASSVELTQIEFNLLCVLIESPYQAFTREELLTLGHGKYTETYERTIDFHIKNLRKKLNLNERHSHIKTIYGVGYRFC